MKNIFVRALLVGCVLYGSAHFVGCTIRPKSSATHEIAYDRNTRNAGFLGFLPDGSGHITASKRDEYNDLVKRFGARWVPSLKEGEGLTVQGLFNGELTYAIDAEHLEKFIIMRVWLKRGDK